MRLRLPRWTLPLGLVLVAGLSYANGLTGDFIWDDLHLVVDNQKVHGLSHVPELLGLGPAHFGFRMVRDLSYALDYTVGGPGPVVFHVANVAYHALVVWLVWLLALRIGLSRAAAFWAGLVFAVHPVHVDAVTYISGRRDLLSTFFYLGSVLAFARFRDGPAGGRGGRWAWLGLAVLLAALGISAKEMAATVPAAWFLYDAWRLGRGERPGIVAGALAALKRHFALYGTGLALAALFVWYTVTVQHATLGEGPMGDSWVVHARTEAVILAYALRLLVLPLPLLIDYQHFFEPVTAPLDPHFLVSLAVLAGLAAWGARAFRGRPAPAFAAHWVWLTYLPAAQIVPHPERFAEHYLYLPSVGAALLFGMGIQALAAAPRTRRAALALGCVVVLAMAAGTWHRNRDFRDEITVFEAALKVHQRAPRVWNNLALAYEEAGRRDDGIRLLEAGMKVTRDPLLTSNLAVLLGHADRWDEALKWLLDAYARYPTDARVLGGLGDTFYRLHRIDDAERAYTKLLAVEPGSVDAQFGLGNVARARGDMAESARRYERVVARQPERGAAWTGLGIARQALGDTDGARKAFERALALGPDDGDAWNNLGVLALLAGDGRTAESHFLHATRVTRPPPAAWLNLARARIILGDCGGALAALRDAETAGAKVPPKLAEAYRARATACPPAP